MTGNEKLKLENIISGLVGFGENEEELKFWLSVFDDLNPAEQEELMRNLKEELRELERTA